jgi:hypothetical protein
MSVPAPDKDYHPGEPDSAATIANRTESATTDPVPLKGIDGESDRSNSDQHMNNVDSAEKNEPSDLARLHTTPSDHSARNEPDDDDSASLTKRPKWYRRGLNPLKWGPSPPVPEEPVVAREYNASFFSRLSFHWMSPLMHVGYKRSLELNDIWKVNPDRSAEAMVPKFDASFDKRVARGDKYPLFWALHETFRAQFWLGGMCQLLAAILGVMSPFVLRFLIAFASEAYAAQRDPTGRKGPPIGRGIGLVVGITVMQMLQSLGTNHFIYSGMVVGGQSRAVLIAVIFEKAMKISGRAKAGGLEIASTKSPRKVRQARRPGRKASREMAWGLETDA